MTAYTMASILMIVKVTVANSHMQMEYSIWVNGIWTNGKVKGS